MKNPFKLLADLIMIIACTISIVTLWNEKDNNVMIIPAFIIGLKVAEMLFTYIFEEKTKNYDK